MTIGLIVGLLFVIVAGASLAVCLHFSPVNLGTKRKAVTPNKLLSLICGIVAGISGVLLVLVPFSFHTVNAGEIAVVKHLGNAVNVRMPGTYFDFWVTESYETYDSKVQTISMNTGTYSSDAQSMNIAMTVQYQIDPTKGIEIANKYGSLEALSARIGDVANGRMKSVLSNYSAMVIIETRESISTEVETAIKDAINSNYYVNVNTIVLTNIDFSDAFEKTVEDKMIAEQEKLKAQYEKETAIVNAEKELEVAKLQAEARIATANAEAQAKVLVARAEAESIKAKSIEVARALGFTIIEKADEDGAITYTIDFTGKTAEEIAVITDYLKYVQYLEAWDGKLPDVVVSDGSAEILIPTT